MNAPGRKTIWLCLLWSCILLREIASTEAKLECGFKFEESEKGYLDLFEVKSIRKISSVPKCRSKCYREKDFTCMSFAYYSFSRSCKLYSESKTTVPYLFKPNKMYQYYVRECTGVRECPENFTSFNNSCYFFGKTSMKWGEAKADCESRGANLVTIESQGEQDFLNRTLATPSYANDLGNFWTAGRTDDFEIPYTWFVGQNPFDGEEFTYTNWWALTSQYRGQRIPWRYRGAVSCSSEPCCVVLVKGLQWKWNEEECAPGYNNEALPLCEMPKVSDTAKQNTTPKAANCK